MVGTIAFVPEEDVDDTWTLLKPLLPPDIIEFTRYYEATWIGSSGNRPTSAYEIWNQNAAGRSLLPRSTNIAEGWHWGFNSMLGCSNPTIWKFLDCVKAEQSLTDMKKTKQIIKERPEQRATRWVHYDRRIQELVDDYQNYANKINFLKVIRIGH